MLKVYATALGLFLASLCADMHAAVRLHEFTIPGPGGESGRGHFFRGNPGSSSLTISDLLSLEITKARGAMNGASDTFGLWARYFADLSSAPEFENQLNFSCEPPANLFLAIKDGAVIGGSALRPYPGSVIAGLPPYPIVTFTPGASDVVPEGIQLVAIPATQEAHLIFLIGAMCLSVAIARRRSDPLLG